MEGISMRSETGTCERDWSKTHWYPVRLEMLLELADARLRVVKDRGRQRRIGVAAGEDVGEVVHRTGAARCDYGNVHRVGDGGGHLAVEPGLGAVPIHRRQQNLAGAPGLGL